MLKSYFQCFAYDENYSYLRQSRKRRSRSFVQGFLKSQFRWFEQSTSISVTDIDGANQTMSTSAAGGGNSAFSASSFLNCTSPGRGGGSIGGGVDWTTSTQAGIVVGTGTTAVTPQDYQLATLVADGTSAGTLEYLTCGGGALTTSASQGSFTLERLFRNSSGGSITLNEVGIYTLFHTAAGAIEHFCIIRDLISPGFAVLNGEYMRVIYTITMSV